MGAAGNDDLVATFRVDDDGSASGGCRHPLEGAKVDPRFLQGVDQQVAERIAADAPCHAHLGAGAGGGGGLVRPLAARHQEDRLAGYRFALPG